jgi:serine protease AprX
MCAPQPASAEPPGLADRDGDRLDGELERRLERTSPTEEVEVLVSLRHPATPARVAELRRGVEGLEVHRRYAIAGVVSASSTTAEALALADAPDVARVELDAPTSVANDSARESFGVAAARAQVPHLDGDEDGRPRQYSPRDLVAAVIDTGIDGAHPDLDDGKVLASVDCVSGACLDRPAGGDSHGHGTHVAGILAGDGEGDARYAGVAPGAGLVEVKALGPTGGGRASAAVAGIEWTVDHAGELGIEAINLSLAGGGCSDGEDAVARRRRGGGGGPRRPRCGRQLRSEQLHDPLAGRLRAGGDGRQHGRSWGGRVLSLRDLEPRADGRRARQARRSGTRCARHVCTG